MQNDQLRACFTDIYDAHAQTIYRHCFFRLLDEAAAQDVLQEAFVRLWTYLADGNEVEHPKAFLYKTADRLIIDLARSRKRRPTVSLEALSDAGFEPADESGEGAAESEASQRSLHRVLGALKQPYRDLIVMRHLDGLSVAEIARITGRSAAVVSVQLHRGLSKLRSLLRDAS